MEQKGLSGDQSSQEGFNPKALDDDKNVQNDELQHMLRDATKSNVHFEMLQLETSSQPQQTSDAHFMAHN